MKRPDISTIAITVVLLALLVPTSAAPGDDIDDSGLVVTPANGANGAYASLDQDGELAISIDGSALSTTGSGVNPNAQTEIWDIFSIRSEASTGMAVWTSDSSDKVVFRIDGSNRAIESPDDCVYLAPGDQRTVGVSIASGSSSGEILQSMTIRAREAVPGDCPGSSTPTPTPGEDTGGGGGASSPTAPNTPAPTEPETPDATAPRAAFDVTPPSQLVCGAVRFDAQTAAEGESAIASYEWTFPEGSATGQSVRHTFESSGEAPVSLTVRDENGRETTVNRTFRVNDQPSVQLIVPADADAGEAVRLRANVTDRFGEVRSITWRFQDGSTKSGQEVVHTFASGERVLEVRALDSCGAVGVTTATIDLSPRGPVETTVDAVNSGIPFAVRSAAVVVLAPLLFALDRRRKGRRRRR